ncbi:MAG: hypothetical protein HYR56_33540 [Acidobacteria bacterium]|nr:hypothetical protein [Acidobacteriota bacterium]MBI3424098.1 hypothetical protein [Acidobacteriota bacterium]
MLTDVVLTVVDTAAIQDYIFSSNRLRENLGASLLVEEATGDWVKGLLVRLKSNIKPVRQASRRVLSLDEKLELELHQLEAELIYAAGGNAAILFRTENLARSFAQSLSRHALKKAPGLQLVIAHRQMPVWNPQANDLKDGVRELIEGKLLEKKKMRQAVPMFQLGLGVSAKCSSTSLPAVRSNRGLEPEKAKTRLIAREAKAKLEVVDKANRRLQYLVAKHDAQGELARLKFTYELDELSRTAGEESYIAVVHADGNSLGERLKKLDERAQDNLQYIKLRRDFSRQVREAAEKALVQTLAVLNKQISEQTTPDKKRKEWVLTEVPPQGIEEKHKTQIAQKKITLALDKDDKNKPYWPFRPLVFGGDDITFVCNGQLGMSLAALYIEEFRRATETMEGGPIHSSAGVSVVKVHYPFRRAYDLSDDLTKEAKNHLGKERATRSALDWHYSTTGLLGSLNVIRQREYTIEDGKKDLLMRPVQIAAPDDWHSWENFQQLIARFNFDERWAGKRNKLKALRDALRAGPEAVRDFRSTYKIDSLPKVAKAERPHQEEGFAGSVCVYFDALEALDHHLLLTSVQLDSGATRAKEEQKK